MTQQHEENAQKWLNIANGGNGTKNGTGNSPKNESSLLQTSSDPICNSAGCSQYRWPKAPANATHPMNYFVPNFGNHDKNEVLTTWNSLDIAQRQLRHVWNFNMDEKKPGPKPILYNYAPVLDDDMISTKNHMDTAEKKYGQWDWKALQLDNQAEESNFEQQ